MIPIGELVYPHQYYLAFSVWIDPKGNIIFTGQNNHDLVAQFMGFKDQWECEAAGYIHISFDWITYMPIELTPEQDKALSDLMLVRTIAQYTERPLYDTHSDDSTDLGLDYTHTFYQKPNGDWEAVKLDSDCNIIWL